MATDRKATVGEYMTPDVDTVSPDERVGAVAGAGHR